jgi:hypothetical protein
VEGLEEQIKAGKQTDERRGIAIAMRVLFSLDLIDDKSVGGDRAANAVIRIAGRQHRRLTLGSHVTPCWSKPDSNLYGAFPVKRLFWVALTVFCSERERPFFVPSPAIRFAERAEGVKGPKR